MENINLPLTPNLLESTYMIYSAKEDGKVEMQTQIALNLLDVLDDETISMKTGLKVEDIKKLRKYEQ